MSKSVIIIGSGFAGLSAASFMAKAGWKVTVLEKHTMPGGRARQFSEAGFTFDMGPSWYWMPDVFERYFNQFGKKVSDYYHLKRLDPSYRVYWADGPVDIPADYEALRRLFDEIEPGSAVQLDKFLKEAAYKYEVGIQKLVYKPGQSLAEFLDWELITGIFRLDVFNSIKSHVAKHFSNPKLKELMEFPVLFLGALPEDTPALYSLMNYADIKGGTWYPDGGMFQIVKAMYDLAVELGVEFRFGEEVTTISIDKHAVKELVTQKGDYNADVVIGGADYHHIETGLLPEAFRTYSNQYWDKRVMAPSCLLYYVGLNKRLNNIHHHTLFFDTSFEVHGKEIYTTREWPSDPLFYMSATSVTDPTVAPEGCENLFLLIPVATGLSDDSEERRDMYFNRVIDRLEKQLGQSVREAIIYKKSFAHSDFVSEYHAFRGNAYGLANTLRQTAVLKPRCRSKKVKNLFYTGQLTVPGPGVPPSLISGEVVAGEVIKAFG
ncbi:MAG: phytoene desaturase family protein [Sediminibacterium sp.]|uniref:phytoene desaturase family protein n=1 Tax=Sediminibacterium sp. TaxID=1917865 RepID=UPI002AB89B3E|nr:phytoene desaturase family protein [Sediminibacterium sp.]MDZ4072024.1 phytoene desaturase family protein [Sediminibacterium sp.]